MSKYQGLMAKLIRPNLLQICRIQSNLTIFDLLMAEAI